METFHLLYVVTRTCSTRLIHWKLSSSVESGLCSATTTILSSRSTVTENTAILQGHRGEGGLNKEGSATHTLYAQWFCNILQIKVLRYLFYV